MAPILPAADYVGAGTVEFIASAKPRRVLFMEMNTWLQEHLVTGRRLPDWTWSSGSCGVRAKVGCPKRHRAAWHAIEARVCGGSRNSCSPAAGQRGVVRTRRPWVVDLLGHC